MKLGKLKPGSLKLRTKLLSILLITSLIPLIVFTSVSAGAFISKSRKDTYQVNEDKLEIVKSKIEGMLDKHFTTLQTIAYQPAVRNFELDKVKSVLVDAAKVNSDLLLCLDNNVCHCYNSSCNFKPVFLQIGSQAICDFIFGYENHCRW